MRVVRAWNERGRVPNVVNVAKPLGVMRVVVVRHLDRVGVLAHVLDVLRTAGLNVQDMENVVLQGRQAAVARISVRGPFTQALLEELLGLDHVISVVTTERRSSPAV